MSNDALFDKLAAEEGRFRDQHFMAPVLPLGIRRRVRVRISGVVIELRPPVSPPGWCVLRPSRFHTCYFVREATMVERRSYLDLLPRTRLVLVRKDDAKVNERMAQVNELRKANDQEPLPPHPYSRWLALPADRNDQRFRIEGLAPVDLVEGAERFDTVVARFDGASFLFDQVDQRRDPAIATWMRERFGELDGPEIEREGLTATEALAYGLAFTDHLESLKDKDEERIKVALERAGAVYKRHADRGDVWSVSYEVAGERFTSTVKKDDLQVVSAGICLTDHRTGRKGDGDYDLQSIIGVLKIGQRRGEIVRMGNRDEPEEDEDW